MDTKHSGHEVPEARGHPVLMPGDTPSGPLPAAWGQAHRPGRLGQDCRCAASPGAFRRWAHPVRLPRWSSQPTTGGEG